MARAAPPRLGLLCLAACALLGAGAEADFSILDEARVLASQMRRLAAEELGVVTMQVGPRAPLLAAHPAGPGARLQPAARDAVFVPSQGARPRPAPATLRAAASRVPSSRVPGPGLAHSRRSHGRHSLLLSALLAPAAL